jgi:hypothetical protein
MTFEIEHEQRVTILDQIGMMNILAISGGRATALPDGVRLPVGCGYSVDVRLTPADEYTVERVFIRAGTVRSKGKREHVFCDELGDTAYNASCFRNDDAEYWPEALTA